MSNAALAEGSSATALLASMRARYIRIMISITISLFPAQAIATLIEEMLANDHTE